MHVHSIAAANDLRRADFDHVHRFLVEIGLLHELPELGHRSQRFGTRHVYIQAWFHDSCLFYRSVPKELKPWRVTVHGEGSSSERAGRYVTSAVP